MTALVRQLVTDVEAALVMGIKPQTLRNKRSQNLGPPYIKIGRTVRYDMADLMAFIDAHRVQPAGEPLADR